ncbi:MAG: hypothetical protein M0Z96_07035 [Actinomycetota bacterium]|nr:hypothetical protein [Actinomycetota bacterium]
MSSSSTTSFPRLSYGGKLASSNVAALPVESLTFSEHMAVFGSPEQYFHALHHLKTQLGENELHGRGGAAFPLSLKLAAYEAYRGKLIVVANGSEGEFLSHKDELLMVRHPNLILDGLAILGSALDAKAGYVHINALKRNPQEAMQSALSDRCGMDPFDIEISTTVPEVGYIAGAESAVISAINRQDGRPQYFPDRPILRGVKKRPTLIANVETLAQLALLARFGATWFSSVGSFGDLGTRLLTVTLANGNYAVLEVIAGTAFSEVFSVMGIQEDQVSCGLLGGYYGQIVDAQRLWKLRVSQPFLKEAGFSLGAGVVALTNCCPVIETKKVLEYLAAESAGQCGPCYFGLPELSKSWSNLSDGNVSSKSLSRVTELCDQIIGRGACAMPDGAVLLARSSLSRFRAEILVHQGGNCSYRPTSGRLVPYPSRLAVR